jgi:hypothetical protein
MLKLTIDQAKHCADVFSNYFDKFERVDDYMRDQKLNALADRPVTLPGMGPEEDLFSDFTMHPNDMEFDVFDMDNERWMSYLEIISSHNNTRSSPGRNLRLAVLEKKTQKWVGFIRLGSPTMMMKPRNDFMGQVVTATSETMKSFNNSAIMGFAIVPAQPFGYNYLGGKLLAAICCSHEVREMVNKKYGMNTCLFETTSLYGSSKTASQYDGMKPYLRFKGLTKSDFLPMINGKTYDDLIEYVENINSGPFVDVFASNRKLVMLTTIVSLTKSALKDCKPEYDKFIETVENAKSLMEQKRYYISNYGISNFADIVMGKTDQLIPDKENYDKFHLENIIDWWKKKASNRYESVKSENRLRTEIEVWTSGKDIDIIR